MRWQTVSGSITITLGFGSRISGFGSRVFDSGFRIPGFGFRVAGRWDLCGALIPDGVAAEVERRDRAVAAHRLPSRFGFHVPGFGFSSFGFRVLGFDFSGSGFRILP